MVVVASTIGCVVAFFDDDSKSVLTIAFDGISLTLLFDDDGANHRLQYFIIIR
jgi:hypothetical protein